MSEGRTFIAGDIERQVEQLARHLVVRKYTAILDDLAQAHVDRLDRAGREDVTFRISGSPADGPKGFAEATKSVFLKTQVQSCIVHLMRHSLCYVNISKKWTIPIRD